jgi:hypothetical protein
VEIFRYYKSEQHLINLNQSHRTLNYKFNGKSDVSVQGRVALQQSPNVVVPVSNATLTIGSDLFVSGQICNLISHL